METITEEEATQNPTLEEMVTPDSDLKNMIVEYVGINSEEYTPYGGDNNEVTVQMIVDLFAKEFPEFLMVVAEENWIRGYHQALEDVDAGRRAELSEREEPNVEL
tara:strand:- start:898 stop:1212 length:315 start_codon:yes stop_codon:yes gene_type:complete